MKVCHLHIIHTELHCHRCQVERYFNKTHPDYFEGTLQLRNDNQELIDAVVKQFEKKGNVQIAKIKKLKTGIDVYVSSQRFLRTLGNKLQAQFGGQLIISRKLHTRHHLRSKDLYRINVLLRLPNFKKGDVINYKGDSVKVIGMSKRVLIKYQISGKKKSVSFDDLM